MSTTTLTPAQVTPVKDGKINWTKNVRALAALAEFKALKLVEKAGEAAKRKRTEEVEPVLMEELNGATEVIVRGVTAIKVIASSNSKIDAALLKAGWPEAYEATYRKTEYTYLKAL